MDMLKVVLPVIVMLGIGYLCREKQVISKEGISGLQALVMNVALPANLFLNFYKMKIALNTVVFPVTFFLIVVLGILGGKLVCRVTKNDDPYVPFFASGYEVGMLGYALLGILIGSGNISTFAMMGVGHDLAIFTVFFGLLKATIGKSQSTKEILKGIFTTPTLVAILSGLILGNSGIGTMIGASSFGPVLDDLLSFGAAPTGCVILVVIGYGLEFKGLNWSAILKVSAIRLVLQTILALVVLGMFHLLGGIYAEFMTVISVILMFTLPPSYIIPLYVEEDEKRVFYSSAVSMYTMLTIIGFTIIAGILYL